MTSITWFYLSSPSKYLAGNKKGDKFSVDNLTIKRPGIGISPMEWDNIMGKSSNDNYKVDDLIKL